MNDKSDIPDIDRKIIAVFIARAATYLYAAEKETVVANLVEFNSLTNQVELDMAIALMTLEKGRIAFLEGYIWTEEQFLNNHSDTLTYFLLNLNIVTIGSQKIGVIQATETLDSQKNVFFLN